VARRNAHRAGALGGLASAVALTVLVTFPAAAIAAPLRLSAQLGELYPGVATPIRVGIDNRSGRTARLRWIRVRPAAGVPGCPAGNVASTAASMRLRIGGGRSRSVRVPVKLRATAPDACQGARFLLRLSAGGEAVVGRGIVATGGGGPPTEPARTEPARGGPTRFLGGHPATPPTVTGAFPGTESGPAPQRSPPAAGGGGSRPAASGPRPASPGERAASTAESATEPSRLYLLALALIGALVAFAVWQRRPGEVG